VENLASIGIRFPDHKNMLLMQKKHALEYAVQLLCTHLSTCWKISKMSGRGFSVSRRRLNAVLLMKGKANVGYIVY